MNTTKTKNRIDEIGGDVPTNGAENTVGLELPYTVEVELTGTSDMLFHRWNGESVEAKATAKKGSVAKKTDDVESYVFRMENGHLGLPGEYLCRSIINAARFSQDPR